jgi:1-pyrroline-5-carboxylate dehydrogenase
MDEACVSLSLPHNEPVLDYRPGSRERHELKACLGALAGCETEIPLLIGGKEVRTGRLGRCVVPHAHGHVLASYHQAGPAEVEQAAEAARAARREWSMLPWAERVSVFLKAAELLAGPWRSTLNAATMLGQSKSVHQAEIDSACELIDYFRFNAHFAHRIYSQQPASSLGVWDRFEWRPLEGFVFAVTPFNFTSIAGNLPSAPVMMGNTVLWKPASSAVYSGYHLMRLWMDAGLPDGVINFIPGPGGELGGAVLDRAELGGIHFTGSTRVFHAIWRDLAARIERYRSYPRVVGETGGKGFIFAHASADPAALVCALVRGAFEYQGQKCSAASRAYVPDNLWPEVRERLLATIGAIRMGDPADFRTFMGAVIDEPAFTRIAGYIDYARSSPDAEILCGGGCDKTRGFFITPTVVLTRDPHLKLMEEEIFGPVLTVFVYPQARYEETLELCDATSPYALTGAVFARERGAIHLAHRRLRYAAGNFYVNDKPTGAVVGLQPFGGSRASGTNDKSGSMLNLMRWVTPRTIKETFVPPELFTYPHMAEE